MLDRHRRCDHKGATTRRQGGQAGAKNGFDNGKTAAVQNGCLAFVDMDKGDFIGRDALVDADRRSLLMGLTCASATPS